MTDKNNDWFSVDKEGLAASIEEPARLPLELWQNAVDENVTVVNIELFPVEGRRGVAYLTVSDDSPEGFLDLTESYKLYAKSKKRDDATKRGRMNVGEKRVLALCEEATITSTTGQVRFGKDGKRQHVKTVKTETGTTFHAIIRLNREQQEEALRLLRMCLVPEKVTMRVNGIEVDHRPAGITTTGTLPTVLPDEEGKLTRKTRRKADIRLVEVQDGEDAHIFEMGIPVCETDTPWHIDVQQRVPLNTERDNVPPAYLRELREHVLNAAFDHIDTETAHSAWVAEALPNASDEAVQKVIEERFGDRVAIFDASCPEANHRAMEAGYTVIKPREVPKGTFSRLRDMGVAKPTGQHQEFRRDIQFSADGKDYRIDPEKWTPGMKRVAQYATDLALELLGYRVQVDIAKYPFGTTSCGAHFGGRNITFNVNRLGHGFFDDGDQERVDELIIHEFAHAKVENHLSDAFYTECCRLGARLRNCKTRL